MRNWSNKRKVAVTALAFVALMMGWIFWWNASQPEPKSDNPSAYVTPSGHTPAPAPTASADTAQPINPQGHRHRFGGSGRRQGDAAVWL